MPVNAVSSSCLNVGGACRARRTRSRGEDEKRMTVENGICKSAVLVMMLALRTWNVE